MSSMTRKIQRNMIRKKCLDLYGSYKAFRYEWYHSHYKDKSKLTDKQKRGLIPIIKRIAKKIKEDKKN